MLANGIDMSVPKYKFTKFTSAKDKLGTPYEITWEELKTRPFIPSEDKDGVGSYYGSLEGHTRGEGRYLDLDLVVLDIDASPDNEAIPLQEALAKYDYIIESTYSHNPEVRNYSYRVLIRLANKVSAKDYPNVVKNLVNKIPYLKLLLKKPNNKNKEGSNKVTTVLDETCFQSSRFYYHPSVSPDRFGTETRYSNRGMPLIPDTHFDESLEKVSSSNITKTPISDLIQGVSEGSRHNECIRLTGLLLSKDFNVKDTLQFMLGWNERCNPPREAQEVIDEVHDIANKYHKENFNIPDELTPVPSDEEEEIIYRFMTREETKNRPPLKWAIDKIALHKAFGAIIGQERNGKSFVGVDMACHVSVGWDWFGHEVSEPKQVIYMALEDWEGVNIRIKGWENHHGVETDVKLLPPEASLIFKEGKKVVDKFIRDLKLQGFSNGVLFFDTLAYIEEGLEEQSNSDRSTVASYFKRIVHELDCIVIVIAHVGKDMTKGLRGGSSLSASMDFRFMVKNNNEITVEKVKNAKDGYGYGYSTELIGEGDEETLVITHTQKAEDRAKTPKGALQVAVRDFIKNQFETNLTDVLIGKCGFEDMTPCFELSKLRELVMQHLADAELVKHKNKLSPEADRLINDLSDKPYFCFKQSIDDDGKYYVFRDRT